MNPPLAAWGLTGTPVPLPGGHRNTVLRVGDHVLKTTRRSEAAIAWLLPVAVRASVSGLTMPRLLRTSSGDFVADGWTCEAFHPGIATSPVEIADRMAAFHTQTSDLPQRAGFATARDMLHQTKCGDIDLSAMPPALVASLRQAWSALSGPPAIIHADLNASNILRASDGTVTLIDWDEARRDVPLFDTVTWHTPHDPIAKRAAMAWEIACSWHVEPDHARRLAQVFSD